MILSMRNTTRISAKELADLSAVLAAPERVEIHSNNRVWRAALLGTLMSTMAISFCAPARAGAESGPINATSALTRAAAASAQAAAPAASAGAQFLPGTNAQAQALARRVGLDDIAATAVTVKPTVYPYGFRAGMDKPHLQHEVVNFVFGGAQIAEPGEGGYLRAMMYLEREVPTMASPAAWNYVARKGDGNRTGCVISVSEQHADAINQLARQTGMAPDLARDFAVIHEGTHCPHVGEKVAAINDLVQSGKVRPERLAGGALGAKFERLVASGRSAEVTAPGFLQTSSEQLSAERYADGFAVLALMAQGRLRGEQFNGLVAWRLDDGADHNTASFLVGLRDALQREPGALQAMRSSGESGFNAAAIAAFLRPRWHQFEMTEVLAAEAVAARPSLAAAFASFTSRLRGADPDSNAARKAAAAPSFNNARESLDGLSSRELNSNTGNAGS